MQGTRNIREQRGRSNLGGAPTPPLPWRPWTRGGTILPSRGRPRKKKKKDGGSLPLSPGVAGVPPGQRSGRRSTSIILLPSTPSFSPSMQRCNLSSPCCNLYLNMVLNSIYYFPMIFGYPMMFEAVLSCGLIVILVGMIVYFIHGAVLRCPPSRANVRGPCCRVLQRE